MSRRHGTLTALAAAGIVAFGASAVNSYAASAPAPKSIYVAPSGKDSNDGSSKKPLASISAALAAAGKGPATIRLASGQYASFRDAIERTSNVTVTGSRYARLAGADLLNSTKLTFSGVTLDKLTTRGVDDIALTSLKLGPVTITNSPTTGDGSSDVSITNSEITAPGLACVTVRAAAKRVTLSGNNLHDCKTGIAGPGDADVADDVTISGNTIQSMLGDGIQFGGMTDVSIVGNTIKDIKDPAGVIHNDAIQLTGGASKVDISRNVMANSGGQLLLIQGSRGPVDDVRIVGNLFHHSSAVAVQLAKVSGVTFANNTVWDSAIGGLLLRSPQPDSVVVNNILSAYGEMEDANPGTVAGNVVGKCGTKRTGLMCNAKPDFVNQAAANYTLKPASTLRSAGVNLTAPLTGLLGKALSASLPGALN